MDPFIGEIKIWPLSYAPYGWHFCDGTLLALQQYQALYSLLGVSFGGNGTTNFALPDMRGRTPVGVNMGGSPADNYRMGQTAGTEGVTLTAQTVPSHAHNVNAYATTATAYEPAGADFSTVSPSVAPGVTSDYFIYLPTSGGTVPSPTAVLNPATVSPTGTSTPHNNMQPYTVLNFCIAIQGAYPSRP